jgi:hypothetical protein
VRVLGLTASARPVAKNTSSSRPQRVPVPHWPDPWRISLPYASVELYHRQLNLGCLLSWDSGSRSHLNMQDPVKVWRLEVRTVSVPGTQRFQNVGSVTVGRGSWVGDSIIISRCISKGQSAKRAHLRSVSSFHTKTVCFIHRQRP